MDRIELKIYHKTLIVGQAVAVPVNSWSIDGGNLVLSIVSESHTDWAVRCVVNKWKFNESVMGESSIVFTIQSETPIEWEVGDFCYFRGEKFTLNYIPSVTQNAKIDKVQNGFVYENVKFDSSLEELTRCMMLDVTPTTGDYVAVYGTNYTGSSRFTLYCGETSINGETLTPVCALAVKIKANLDRMFPQGNWQVHVDTETTYTDSAGNAILVTHTDDKMLSFDNTTVAAALAMVNTEFDLDYFVKGHDIYIGYTLKNLTSDDDEESFAFGFGKGYPTSEEPGKGLFQIKQSSDSQQKIVTRLRALGSTKNLPYRYYNKKYASEQNPALSQTLFPLNLQLPGTFLPEGEPSDTADADGSTKWSQNNARDDYFAAVKGDTNDAYIDKNDDAEGCIEGVREDCARWDGSNGDLPEIYPTIEGMTFGELRNAGVPDQRGVTGAGAYQGASLQPNEERVDCLLGVGHYENGVLVDDANIGDGILPEDGNNLNGITKPCVIGSTTFDYIPSEHSGSLRIEGRETDLFTIPNVSPGSYAMAPTGPSYDSNIFGCSIASSGVSADVGFVMRIKQVVSGTRTTIAEYTSVLKTVTGNGVISETALPELPDVKEGASAQVQEINVTQLCDIVVTFAPFMENISARGRFSLAYQVGKSRLSPSSYDSEYTWISADNATATNSPFHVFIKDMGFNLEATFTGDTPILAMKTGRCVGREFEIGSNVVTATYNGKRGYLLTLNRAVDSNLNVYYPNANDTIAAGDYFVLLGISMPDAYIKAAEVRLLKAATDYLADNCETKPTYQPFLDDIYLQRNYDNMVAAGMPENSIFWRLTAGMKFTFRGIPRNDRDPLPLLDITIQQLSIAMGEGLTPKVDVVLNDDTQQSTIQRLVTAVDRIYNGSIFGSGYGGGSMTSLYEILKTEGGRMFLSRLKDDVANGKITFNDIATFVSAIKARSDVFFGDFFPGFLGSGAKISADGKGEFQEINIRGALRATELVFNLISAEEGESIRSIGHGEIESVTINPDNPNRGTAVLKLDGDEWASVSNGDICRGTFSTFGDEGLYDDSSDDEDANGFRNKKGFFSSYFRIISVTSEKGSCSFTYQLQVEGKSASQSSLASDTAVTEHPCALMKFAIYGNTNANRKERQSSMYITAVGIAPRILFLAGVDDWNIKPENIKIASGNIQDTVVWNEVTEAEYNDYSGTDGVDKKYWDVTVDGETVRHYAVLQSLVGDAGIYCEDNIYLGGIINQLKSAAIDAITSEISNLGQAWVSTNIDRYVIDCDANGYPLAENTITIYASLFFGNKKCTLVTDLSKTNISGFGSSGGTFIDNNETIYREIVIDPATTARPLSSEIITVKLTGTHDGNEFTATKSVAVIANKQGVPGTSGGGAAWIDAIPSSILVECDSDGKISASHSEDITASLYVGETRKVTLSANTATYNGTGYTPAITKVSESNGVTTWRVAFSDMSNPLPASSIELVMSDGTVTAHKTILVIPVRRGQPGDSVAGYSAYLTKSSDSIVIDGDGNIIGGLGLNRLSTEVKIWDAANSRYLTYTSDRLTDGKFNYTTKAVNCQVSVGIKGEIVIDSITDKTLNSCEVGITVRTYDNVLYNFVYTVSLAHIDQSYLTFDLNNEYDSIAYRTQTHRYDGLPLSATLKCYANDVEHVDEGVTYGNVRLYDSISGYINKVVVTSDLFSDSVTALPRKQYNQEGELIGITHVNATAIIIRDANNADTGLRLVVNSGGTVTLRHYRTSGDEIDLPDTKHWIDISCEVIYGGVTYVSPTKRMTIAEVTDSTIYRLMLSATAISQEESTYTPSSIDVKASVTDESGTTIYSMVGSDPSDHLEADGVALANRNIKIRYINGVYDPNGVNTLLSVCPQFANLTDKVLTVVLVDLTDLSSPVYLDIQTVTINSGGKDGAGQSWINASHDQFVVDCDENGKPITSGQRSVTIEASLRWGDELCEIATLDDVSVGYATTGTNEPTISSVSWKPTADANSVIKTTVTFRSTLSYNSGTLTLTITGLSRDGIRHTASKTIAFIINRKGQAGSVIDTITTYYLITDKASGVTTADIGWVDSFIEPTAEYPYLWRYSRYSYTDGSYKDTNCELISVYSDRPNINLLDDTYFGSIEAMDAWTQKGELNRYLATPVHHEVSASNGIYQVIFQGYQGSGGENGNIEYLTQPVYAPNIEKIRPNSWYTLSFWLYGGATQEGALPTSKSFYLNLDMTGLFNSEYPRYVDGVESPNTNVLVQFVPDNTWTMHTVTFKTPSALSGTINVRFIMQTMYIRQDIQMKSPKLEIGMVATDYVNGNVSRQPMARTSRWETGKQYYKGVVGERYIDIVSVNGKWYQCLRSHLSSDENKPQQDTETAYWSPANNFNFIATSLLLADTGVINLLFGNAIYMRDKQDRLTASLNEEGTGNYIIYYPESGNKLMQFGSDGYIRFYNDDTGNTEQWRLGFGGDIKSGTSDDWKPKMLYKLASNTPNFTADTVFNRTMYFEFRSAIGGQFGAFDHGFFSSHNTDNPTNETAAVSGWYTPDPMPWHKIDDDGDTMNYGITMYHIVRENVTIGTTTYKVAKIAGTQGRIFDGTNYINEVYS